MSERDTRSEVAVALAGKTDVGLVREHNEDNFVVARLDDGSRDIEALASHVLGERGTLLVVCDGMGGAAAGEIASGMAIESLTATMLDGTMTPAPAGLVDDDKTHLVRKLRSAARDANTRIFRDARANSARAGMGTTMTAVQLWRDLALIAQVGDSRAYVFRQGRLVQLTRDQSLVNQLLETGQITAEQAKFFEHSNVILQALGVQEEVEVQLAKCELRRDDRLLVCSDGLVGVVADEEIGELMGAASDPAAAAKALIDRANAGGGPDNITVLIAFLGGEGLRPPESTDVLGFTPWRIDPEAKAASFGIDSMTETVDGFVRVGGMAPALPTPRSATAWRSWRELLSMAFILGLLFAGTALGMLLYGRGVVCRLVAPQSSLVVVVDGRDSGMRTVEGALQLRLAEGLHRVSLYVSGSPLFGERQIEVSAGQRCELDFGESATRR